MPEVQGLPQLTCQRSVTDSVTEHETSDRTVMAKSTLPRWLVWRGEVIQFKRNVPRRYLRFVSSPVVRISLETADVTKAVIARDRLNTLTEEYWRSLARGEGPNERDRYLAAIERARLEGFTYQPLDALRSGTVTALLDRLAALEAKFPELGADTGAKISVDARQMAVAVLGTAKEPSLKLSNLVQVYEDLTRLDRRLMSDAQRHKWKLPHDRAQKNLLDVVGDKPIAEFSRADALTFQSWWLERIETENLSPESANKDITHLGKMIATISDRHDLDLPRKFRGLRFKVEGNKRPSFSTKHIREVLLAAGAFDGLNVDARAIVMVLVELGARPSEIAGLRPEDIRLDAEIPHISIESYPGRMLKTSFSKRTLLVLGVALEGAKLIRDGADAYKDRGGTLSATVGKFMYENKLLERDDQSLYSFRHSFKDRLTEAGAPDIVDAALMGHKFDRPNYGEGPSLALKLEWLTKIRITSAPGEEG